MEFIDKRKINTKGEALVVEAELPAPPEDFVPEEGCNTWKEVCYVSGLTQQKSGSILLGKAIGIRGDDRVFDSEIPLPSVWEEKECWQNIAKARLDSYLGCSCNELGICKMHQMLLEEWRKADNEKLAKQIKRGMPKPMRAYMELRQKLQQSLDSPPQVN